MITPPAQKHGAHVDEGVHEEVRNMVNLLSASDWKSRYDGVSRFRDICLECPEIISVNTMKVWHCVSLVLFHWMNFQGCYEAVCCLLSYWHDRPVYF